MNFLKICTWNINFGLRLERILEEVEGSGDFQNLDFLFLQETANSEPICQALRGKYSFLESTAQTVRGNLQSNAILWNRKNFDLQSAFSLSLPNYRLTKIPRREKIILNRIAPQKRIALMVEGKFKKLTVRLYCVHLDVLGWAHKKEQLIKILENDKNLHPVDFVLICGDFNTISHLLTNLNSLAKNFDFVESTKEVKKTFQHRLVRNRKLDMIFIKASSVLKLSSTVWTKPTKASDHLPVFATYEISNNSRRRSKFF